MAAFFGFHVSLMGAGSTPEPTDEQRETLSLWCGEAHELYIIQRDTIPVGFIHIGYRGSNVAWIEDIFVEESYRGQGIATEAIGLVEQRVQSNPAYNALCIDVVPRNEAAIRLYHRLGYDALSLLTLRKSWGGPKRDREMQIHDLKFRY